MTFFEGLMLGVLATNTFVLALVSADIDMIKLKLGIKEKNT